MNPYMIVKLQNIWEVEKKKSVSQVKRESTFKEIATDWSGVISHMKAVFLLAQIEATRNWTWS